MIAFAKYSFAPRGMGGSLGRRTNQGRGTRFTNSGKIKMLGLTDESELAFKTSVKLTIVFGCALQGCE